MVSLIKQNLRTFISLCMSSGGALLTASMLLSIVSSPVAAAEASLSRQGGADSYLLQACTPPADWGQTVRLESPHRSSQEWSFTVDEPEMDVTLEIFYYQDYSRDGCPYDCTSGECQLDETGTADSPLGGIQVEDGQLAARAGSESLSGRLSQGVYQVVFRVTGRGSINVGFRARTASLPTEPPPTDTPEPSPTPIPPTATPPATYFPPTQTPTGTYTPPTATPTSTSLPPTPTLTPTYTATPTDTPPGPTVLPPNPTPTPTADTPPGNGDPTPPPTLPPPAPPVETTQPPVLIPVTGADLSQPMAKDPTHSDASMLPGLLINIGVALLGFGLVMIGVARYFNRTNS